MRRCLLLDSRLACSQYPSHQTLTDERLLSPEDGEWLGKLRVWRNRVAHGIEAVDPQAATATVISLRRCCASSAMGPTGPATGLRIEANRRTNSDMPNVTSLGWRFVLTALPFCALSVTALAQTDPERRTAFLKAIDRPKVAANVEIQALPKEGDLMVDRFSFTPEAGIRLSGFVHRKSEGPSQRPVVIVLHGTGGNAEGMLNSYSKPLANGGLMTVSMTARHHGTGGANYNQAITQAYVDGKSHPFLYDSVWDLERLIDYLETRPDVDRTRIGVIGLSKGGMESWLAAAVDSRLTATVPLIAVQSFRYEIEHDAWQARADSILAGFDGAAKSEGAPLDAAFMRKFLDRISPGLTSDFDGPAMVPLIAPRPLLVINGEVDPRNPLPSVMAIADLTKAAYRAAGKPDNFELVIEPGTAHAVTAEARQKAIDWLVARLGSH